MHARIIAVSGSGETPRPIDALARSTSVKVTFQRTGERRYGVLVERDRSPTVVMSPAPGFDEFLPHDLLHFVGEAEWGLDGAVFGRLAAGDDAGTFWPVDKTQVAKAMRRRRRTPKGTQRGRRSELIADVLERAWNARRGRSALPEDWEDRVASARIEPERLEAVLVTLDDLAARWHALAVDESLTLEWPRPERRRHPARARAAADPRRRLARRA